MPRKAATFRPARPRKVITARGGAAAMRRRGGFIPLLPIAAAAGSAIAAPILAKLGSKLASLIGLGARRRMGRGVVRAGATRKSGGMQKKMMLVRL